MKSCWSCDVCNRLLVTGQLPECSDMSPGNRSITPKVWYAENSSRTLKQLQETDTFNSLLVGITVVNLLCVKMLDSHEHWCEWLFCLFGFYSWRQPAAFQYELFFEKPASNTEGKTHSSVNHSRYENKSIKQEVEIVK